MISQEYKFLGFRLILLNLKPINFVICTRARNVPSIISSFPFVYVRPVALDFDIGKLPATFSSTQSWSAVSLTKKVLTNLNYLKLHFFFKVIFLTFRIEISLKNLLFS